MWNEKNSLSRIEWKESPWNSSYVRKFHCQSLILKPFPLIIVWSKEKIPRIWHTFHIWNPYASIHTYVDHRDPHNDETTKTEYACLRTELTKLPILIFFYKAETHSHCTVLRLLKGFFVFLSAKYILFFFIQFMLVVKIMSKKNLTNLSNKISGNMLISIKAAGYFSTFKSY